MYPFIELGDVKIFAYGATLVAAAFATSILAWRRRPSTLFSFDQFVSICLLTTAGSIIGARLGFIILSDHQDSLWGALRIWEKGGLASLGVPVVVVPLLLLYFVQQRLSTLGVLDYLISFAIFGAACQRTFGCFFAGCCYGSPTEVPWGARFPGMESSVHPTQLYLGMSFFALFAVLELWHPELPGRKVLVATGLYGVVNMSVNIFRDDVSLAWAQCIYGLLVVFCGMFYVVQSRRNTQSTFQGASI